MASFILGPLKRYLSDVLTSRLAEYVEGIELGDLGVLGSDLVVSNVSLRKERLQALLPPHLGLSISRSSADELRISIPWTSLLSSPISIKLQNVQLSFTVDGGAAAEHASAMSSDAPAAAPAAKTAAKASSALPDWLNSRLVKIFANIAFTVEGLALRIESPRTGVYLLATAGVIDVSSADAAENWATGFAEPVGCKPFVAKSISLLDIMLECDAFRGSALHCIRPDGEGEGVSSSNSTDAATSAFEDPLLSKMNMHIRGFFPLALFAGQSVACKDLHTRPMWSSSSGSDSTGGHDDVVQYSLVQHAVQRLRARFEVESDLSTLSDTSAVEDDVLTCYAHVLVDFFDVVASVRQLRMLEMLMHDQGRNVAAMSKASSATVDAPSASELHHDSFMVCVNATVGGMALTVMQHELKRLRGRSDVTTASSEAASGSEVLRVPVHKYGIMVVSASAEKKQAVHYAPTPVFRADIGCSRIHAEYIKAAHSSDILQLADISCCIGTARVARWSHEEDEKWAGFTSVLRRKLADLIYLNQQPGDSSCPPDLVVAPRVLLTISGPLNYPSSYVGYEATTLFSEVDEFFAHSRFMRQQVERLPEYDSVNARILLQQRATGLTTCIKAHSSDIEIDCTDQDILRLTRWAKQLSRREKVSNMEPHHIDPTRPHNALALILDCPSVVTHVVDHNGSVVDLRLRCDDIRTAFATQAPSNTCTSEFQTTMDIALHTYIAVQCQLLADCYHECGAHPEMGSGSIVSAEVAKVAASVVISDIVQVDVALAHVMCKHCPKDSSFVLEEGRIQMRCISEAWKLSFTKIYIELGEWKTALQLRLQGIHANEVRPSGESEILRWPVEAAAGDAFSGKYRYRHSDCIDIAVRSAGAFVHVHPVLMCMSTAIHSFKLMQRATNTLWRSSAVPADHKPSEPPLRTATRRVCKFDLDIGIIDLLLLEDGPLRIVLPSIASSSRDLVDGFEHVVVVAGLNIVRSGSANVQERSEIHADLVWLSGPCLDRVAFTVHICDLCVPHDVALRLVDLTVQIVGIIHSIQAMKSVEAKRALATEEALYTKKRSKELSVALPEVKIMLGMPTKQAACPSFWQLHICDIDFKRTEHETSSCHANLIIGSFEVAAIESGATTVLLAAGGAEDAFLTMSTEKSDNEDGLHIRIGALSGCIELRHIAALVGFVHAVRPRTRVPDRADIPRATETHTPMQPHRRSRNATAHFEGVSVNVCLSRTVTASLSSNGGEFELSMENAIQTVDGVLRPLAMEISSDMLRRGTSLSCSVGITEFTHHLAPHHSQHMIVTVESIVFNGELEGLASAIGGAPLALLDEFRDTDVPQVENKSLISVVHGHHLEIECKLGCINGSIVARVGCHPLIIALRQINVGFSNASDGIKSGHGRCEAFSVTYEKEHIAQIGVSKGVALDGRWDTTLDVSKKARLSVRVSIQPICIRLPTTFLALLAHGLCVLRKLRASQRVQPMRAAQVLHNPDVDRPNVEARLDVTHLSVYLPHAAESIIIRFSEIHCNWKRTLRTPPSYVDYCLSVPWKQEDAVMLGLRASIEYQHGESSRFLVRDVNIEAASNIAIIGLPTADHCHTPHNMTDIRFVVGNFEGFVFPCIVLAANEYLNGSKLALEKILLKQTALERPLVVSQAPDGDKQAAPCRMLLSKFKQNVPNQIHERLSAYSIHGDGAQYMLDDGGLRSGWWVCCELHLGMPLFVDAVTVSGPLFLPPRAFLRFIENLSSGTLTAVPHNGLVKSIECVLEMYDETSAWGSWIELTTLDIPCEPLEKISCYSRLSSAHEQHELRLQCALPAQRLRVRWKEPMLSHSSSALKGSQADSPVAHPSYAAVSTSLLGMLMMHFSWGRGSPSLLEIAPFASIVRCHCGPSMIYLDVESTNRQHPACSETVDDGGVVGHAPLSPVFSLCLVGDVVYKRGCKQEMIMVNLPSFSASTYDTLAQKSWTFCNAYDFALRMQPASDGKGSHLDVAQRSFQVNFDLPAVLTSWVSVQRVLRAFGSRDATYDHTADLRAVNLTSQPLLIKADASDVLQRIDPATVVSLKVIGRGTLRGLYTRNVSVASAIPAMHEPDGAVLGAETTWWNNLEIPVSDALNDEASYFRWYPFVTTVGGSDGTLRQACGHVGLLFCSGKLPASGPFHELLQRLQVADFPAGPTILIIGNLNIYAMEPVARAFTSLKLLHTEIPPSDSLGTVAQSTGWLGNLLPWFTKGASNSDKVASEQTDDPFLFEMLWDLSSRNGLVAPVHMHAGAKHSDATITLQSSRGGSYVIPVSSPLPAFADADWLVSATQIACGEAVLHVRDYFHSTLVGKTADGYGEALRIIVIAPAVLSSSASDELLSAHKWTNSVELPHNTRYAYLPSNEGMRVAVVSDEWGINGPPGIPQPIMWMTNKTLFNVNIYDEASRNMELMLGPGSSTENFTPLAWFKPNGNVEFLLEVGGNRCLVQLPLHFGSTVVSVFDSTNPLYCWQIEVTAELDRACARWTITFWHATVLHLDSDIQILPDPPDTPIIYSDTTVAIAILSDSCGLVQPPRFKARFASASRGSTTPLLTLGLAEAPRPDNPIHLQDLELRFGNLTKLYSCAHIPRGYRVRCPSLLQGSLLTTVEITTAPLRKMSTLIMVRNDTRTSFTFVNNARSPCTVSLPKALTLPAALQQELKAVYYPQSAHALYGFLSQVESAWRISTTSDYTNADDIAVWCASQKASLAIQLFDAEESGGVPSQACVRHPYLQCVEVDSPACKQHFGCERVIHFDVAFLIDVGLSADACYSPFVPCLPAIWHESWGTAESSHGTSAILSPYWMCPDKALRETSISFFSPAIECVFDGSTVQIIKPTFEGGSFVYTAGDSPPAISSHAKIKIDELVVQLALTHDVSADPPILLEAANAGWWKAATRHNRGLLQHPSTGLGLYCSHIQTDMRQSAELEWSFSAGSLRLSNVGPEGGQNVVVWGPHVAANSAALRISGTQPGLYTLPTRLLTLDATFSDTLRINLSDATVVPFKRLVTWFADAFPSMPSRPPSLHGRIPIAAHFYIGQLKISELRLDVTLQLNDPQLPVDVGVRNCHLALSSIEASNVNAAANRILREVLASYVADAIVSFPSLLGSLDLLGNVGGLVGDVGTAISDLVWTPVRALRAGHGLHLPINLVLQTLDSTGNVVVTAGRSVFSSLSGIALGLARTAGKVELALDSSVEVDVRARMIPRLAIMSSRREEDRLAEMRWDSIPQAADSCYEPITRSAVEWIPAHHYGQPSAPAVTDDPERRPGEHFASGLHELYRGFHVAAESLARVPVAAVQSRSAASVASALSSAVVAPLVGSLAFLGRTAEEIVSMLESGNPMDLSPAQRLSWANFRANGVWQTDPRFWAARFGGCATVLCPAILLCNDTNTVSVTLGYPCWLCLGERMAALCTAPLDKAFWVVDRQSMTFRILGDRSHSYHIPSGSVCIELSPSSAASAEMRPGTPENPFRHDAVDEDRSPWHICVPEKDIPAVKAYFGTQGTRT